MNKTSLNRIRTGTYWPGQVVTGWNRMEPVLTSWKQLKPVKTVSSREGEQTTFLETLFLKTKGSYEN
jgi:hypothetical protein